MPQHSRAPRGSADRTCPNCGAIGRHDSTCLLAAQADRLRADDLARLAALGDPDGSIERPLHHSEVAMLAVAAGRALNRRERRDIVVVVGPWGGQGDAVVRAYHRGGRVVGGMISATTTVEATR